MTAFEQLLLAIEDQTAQMILQQLRDPDKCTPALIGQAIRYLEKHKVEINKFEKDVNVLGDLADALPPLELPPVVSEDDLYGS